MGEKGEQKGKGEENRKGGEQKEQDGCDGVRTEKVSKKREIFIEGAIMRL